MRRFPSEFKELLAAPMRKLAQSKRPLREFATAGSTPVKVFTPAVPRRSADGCLGLLERHLYRHMHRMAYPIPSDIIPRMRRNYSESLPKTMQVRTADLNGSNTKPVRAAKAIGLLDMLRSASLRQFAEGVTGHSLERECSMQAICYEHGDYSGPHNDHHPEEAHLRDGYVDLHLMFCNRYVDRQYLVYERRGFLSEAVNVAQPSGIAVYRLPFWHQVTPLVGQTGRERLARRWLLLASFAIAR